MGDVDALINIAEIVRRGADSGMDALDALEDIRSILRDEGYEGEDEKEQDMRDIACNWHGGAGSAMYVFCSTGNIVEGLQEEVEADLNYVKEQVGGQYTPRDLDDLERLYAHIW